MHYIERAAKYIQANKAGRDSLPFISGGDFNAQPISSAMSVFYNENIEQYDGNVSPSTWRIPEDFERERQLKYIRINELLQKKISTGRLNPLIGNLESAY